MQLDDAPAEGIRVMTVCNSCRYCEQYCAVFPAMTQRLRFDRGDISYLANLCHNCGECLYACQYAPPHEFAIDVPRTFAHARTASYQQYCWPRLFGAAFRRHELLVALLLVGALVVVMALVMWTTDREALAAAPPGDFYAVMPHGVMVALFGSVAGFVLVAMAVTLLRFWRDVHDGPLPSPAAVLRGLREAMTLRHLHASGRDCTTAEEHRVPWRRWFHHFTFYGFMLCFASTSVAAFYHLLLRWEAPYPVTSLPVVLGVAGGVGLLIGPAGLLWDRYRRDNALVDDDHRGLDLSLIVLLALTSFTGLLLLVLRSTTMMPSLLIVHLAVVLALFLTLPYGKFMHGLYRTAALIKAAGDTEADDFDDRARHR